MALDHLLNHYDDEAISNVLAMGWIDMQKAYLGIEDRTLDNENAFDIGESLLEACYSHPKLALSAIRLLGCMLEYGSEFSNEQRLIPYLGAGPLQDLLGYNGLSSIDEIVAECQTSSSIRKAVRYVDDAGFHEAVAKKLMLCRES